MPPKRPLPALAFLDQRDLERWVRAAKAGERLIYYQGRLAADAQHHAEPLERERITRLKLTAMALSDGGLVNLFQARIANGYQYLMVRRLAP